MFSYDKHNINQILSMLNSLKNIEITNEEKIVIYYFVKNISVGEILALKELRALGVKNPSQLIRRLMVKGILEKGEGCYNLAKNIREEVFKLRRKGFFKV